MVCIIELNFQIASKQFCIMIFIPLFPVLNSQLDCEIFPQKRLSPPSFLPSFPSSSLSLKKKKKKKAYHNTCKIYLNEYPIYKLGLTVLISGLPWWLSDKESICQCRKHEFNPWAREDPIEKEMAAFSSILGWEIPWTESLLGYSPVKSQKSWT